MDHNYARGKLTLLLRDIRNYNAGEFWREMSRIASGATASIHAEGLKAERAALADSNTQLMQQNEAQIKMNAQLMHERDALASQNSKLRILGGRLRQHFNLREMIGGGRRRLAIAWDDAEAEDPDTSLARRDAQMKAEALEQMRRDIRIDFPASKGKSGFLADMGIRIESLRRQAEEADQ